MDTINVTPKAGMQASPKITKTKQPMASSTITRIAYGCNHLESLFKEVKKHSVTNYTLLQERWNHGPAVYTAANAEISSTIHFSKTSGYKGVSGLADLQPKQRVTATHTSTGKKRKSDELSNPEDARLVALQASFIPCRAIGLRGLYNMGQTCFMSVILQSLVHNPFIRAYYLSEGHRPADCEKESCTSCALDEIFMEYYSSEKTEGYGAVSMLMASWMGAQALAGYQQQDAHEYMQFILHALHSENGGTSETSASSPSCPCIIHQTFYGHLTSTVTCDKCHNITTAIDPIMDLSLDLRSQAKRRKLDAADPTKSADIELKECLDRFTAREKLPAADYTCQKCEGGQHAATKQLSVKTLPPVLCIHLKRFEHSKAASSKIETNVRFPLQLDMWPYTTRAKSAAVAEGKKGAVSAEPPAPSCVYELSSVVVHKGKLDSGHYISYSREGSEWFQFDDSKVILASEAEVLAANAYLLFYIVRELD
ncbi:hypothetical protein H2199_002144 [Coniosporium tulheliwenetii]|uniref:Uncharacterized protein n=1 Tax=Coniosporium tulheliwenetii TaxID=3383036 RepID=A0ACC2ZI31_9PEZI|nr:hypothetical protein H2199_002144 [Cladosporium sp. JES 115]